jgi:hypothetical protein
MWVLVPEITGKTSLENRVGARWVGKELNKGMTSVGVMFQYKPKGSSGACRAPTLG